MAELMYVFHFPIYHEYLLIYKSQSLEHFYNEAYNTNEIEGIFYYLYENKKILKSKCHWASGGTYWQVDSYTLCSRNA